jgi:UDP-2,3-diacylglucosamine hydrolase
MSMDPIAVIAGSGRLPLHVAGQAAARGHRTIVIAFPGFTDAQIETIGEETVWLKPGQLQKAVSFLRDRGIARVVMVGKLEKKILMRPWRLGLDRRALRMIRGLKDWRDDTILAAIAAEFHKDGIKVEEITDWAADLMAPVGVITNRRPSEKERRDIEFGREMAQGVGALDIGQTVVVKNAAVIVVEAIEGTDLAVRRTADLGISEGVVVKMAKPKQDMRFDVPGVGPATIDSMIAANARVLAVEAGKTMISDYAEMIRKADLAGISVVGVPASGPIP